MLSHPKARRLFDPRRKIYAQRSMRVSGENYLRGDEIKWQQLDIPVHIVQSWFRMRLISHFKGGDQSPEAKTFYREFQAEPAPAESVDGEVLFERKKSRRRG